MVTTHKERNEKEVRSCIGKYYLHDLLRPDYLIWVLLLILLAERLVLFRQLGADYMSHSDDDAYIQAGLYFAQTGTISMWGPFPSAMIMPGMPVIIGLFSFVFGDGITLIVALKILWICMGVITAYLCYRTVADFASAWGGLFAAAHFLIPNMAWMNHVLLTETPYMLFFVMTVFFTLKMGSSRKWKYFIGYVLSFMAGLMFRANMMSMLFFSGAYILIIRHRMDLRRMLIFVAALMLFVVPWTFRNQRQFHAFIPITYGAGNPALLGTYQGEGYPADEELDYETNVEQVMHERYAEYYRDEAEPWEEAEDTTYYIRHFDPDGEVTELRYAQFLSLQADGVKARYRIREWIQNDLKGFLKSYLLIKPRWMLNWSWAWEEAFHVPYSVLHRISQMNAVWCAATVIMALFWKKYRKEVLFTGLVYLISVYIFAMAFVTDRYASTLMALRYILAGYGCSLICSCLKHRCCVK